MPPFGSPNREGGRSNRSEAPEESQVVRLIYPKPEPVPVSTDIGAGGNGAPRLPPSQGQPRFARCF